MLDEESARRLADEQEETRWPAMIGVLVVGGLNLALPHSLRFGPSWLLLAVVASLSIPAVIAWKCGNQQLSQRLGFVLSTVITLALIASVIQLVRVLPTHLEAASALLRSAAALWLTNILVFALWYWRLDAGGPHIRDLSAGHVDGAFLFPQMMMHPDAKRQAGETYWSPTFVDYLFLAFNTSSALSPTDTAVLSRWAKILMMLQSMISLTIIAVLAGRAVNIM